MAVDNCYSDFENSSQIYKLKREKSHSIEMQEKESYAMAARRQESKGEKLNGFV